MGVETERFEKVTLLGCCQRDPKNNCGAFCASFMGDIVREDEFQPGITSGFVLAILIRSDINSSYFWDIYVDAHSFL